MARVDVQAGPQIIREVLADPGLSREVKLRILREIEKVAQGKGPTHRYKNTGLALAGSIQSVQTDLAGDGELSALAKSCVRYLTSSGSSEHR